MKNSFTLTRAELEAADAASLKARILSQTGCEAQAASILRSLERIGTDPTIEYYEMIEIAGRRMYGTTGTPTWRVRADRGVVEEPAQ